LQRRQRACGGSQPFRRAGANSQQAAACRNLPLRPLPHPLLPLLLQRHRSSLNGRAGITAIAVDPSTGNGIFLNSTGKRGQPVPGMLRYTLRCSFWQMFIPLRSLQTAYHAQHPPLSLFSANVTNRRRGELPLPGVPALHHRHLPRTSVTRGSSLPPRYAFLFTCGYLRRQSFRFVTARTPLPGVYFLPLFHWPNIAYIHHCG